MVEKVFTQANLADCLQIKLSDHSLNDSERTKVAEDLRSSRDVERYVPQGLRIRPFQRVLC